jgi:hypothetical protein
MKMMSRMMGQGQQSLDQNLETPKLQKQKRTCITKYHRLWQDSRQQAEELGIEYSESDALHAFILQKQGPFPGPQDRPKDMDSLQRDAHVKNLSSGTCTSQKGHLFRKYGGIR